MDDKNQKQTNPFGAYRYGADGPNKPRDISADLWTPISTGVPLQTPAKLQDVDQTPPQKPEKPAAPRSRNKQPAKRKQTKGAQNRKPAAQSNARTRPVVEDQPPKNRQPSPARSRQSAERERRERENERRQYERSKADFDSERSAGRSSDDIRRSKAKRKRRNKKLFAVVTVAAVMVLAGLCALVYCFVYGAPIAKITVTGKTDYTSEQIIDASGIRIGDNMLRVGKKEVNRAVCGALPYVASVKVEYKLPDTLSLRVTPATEKYLIVGKKNYICLSESGKVLSLKKKKVKEGQFRLEGFDEQTAIEGGTFTPEGDNEKRFDAAKLLITQLEKNELTTANVLQLADLRLIVIQFEGRINIYLNGTDDAEEKISLIAGILKNEISPNSQGYIDARFEHRAFFNEGSMSIEG